MKTSRSIPHFFFLFLFSTGVALAADSPPIISRIKIRATDIFDFETKPYLDKFPYTWINALHIRTREEIIRQELLFDVGDPLDLYLVRETERNLRALSFVRAARIARFPQRDGTVVLVVHTSDSWTTEPQLNLGGTNRVDEIELGFREKNLLGSGKTLQFLYKRSPDRSEREYSYYDPRLFHSRWQLRTELIDHTEGNERNISLDHPFFSADTPWSLRATHRRVDDTIGQFENSVRVSEFQRLEETGEVYGGIKIGGGRRVVSHGGLRYKNVSQNFERISGTHPNRGIPASQHLQTIFADFDITRNKFVELTKIEKMTRVEDFNLGPTLIVSPGISPRAFTGRRDVTQLESAYEQRFLPNDGHFVQTRLTASARNPFEIAENRRYLAMGKYYYRDLPRQTLVTHMRVEWGDRLDADNHILLGNDNGLRGYKKEDFVGSKSFLFNIEDRFFFIDELFHLVSVGAVAFYETGYAWSRGDRPKFSDLRGDLGAGLRLGLTKSSNEVIVRVDVAYRLQRGGSDTSHFVVSFGSGQAF